MMKLAIIIVSLILAIAVGLVACTTTTPSATAPAATTKSIEKSFNVPMTGVHIEYFKFNAGDRILARFEVEGKYPIALGINGGETLYDDKGNLIRDTSTGTLVDIDYSLSEHFSFIVPVSEQYRFFFAGYYSKIRPGENREPFTQLSQVVKLYITVNPK